MIIIYRGWGKLVPVIVIAMAFLSYEIGSSLGGELANLWCVGLGLALSAAILFVLGRTLNGVPNRTLVDPETGEEVIEEREGIHTFFFIPMQHWAWPVLGAGFLSLWESLP